MTYQLATKGVIRFDPDRDPVDGKKILPDKSNADWQEYLAWVAAAAAVGRVPVEKQHRALTLRSAGRPQIRHRR